MLRHIIDALGALAVSCGIGKSRLPDLAAAAVDPLPRASYRGGGVYHPSLRRLPRRCKVCTSRQRRRHGGR